MGEADSYYNNSDQRGGHPPGPPPQYDATFGQQQPVNNGYQAPPPPPQPQQQYAPPANGPGEFDEKQSFEQTFKVEKPKWNDIWAGILVDPCHPWPQQRTVS